MKKWIIGVDEVGRGPLAGPVCVCAAAMPLAAYKKMQWVLGKTKLTDSKQMAPAAREVWSRYAKMLEKEGKIRFGISMRSAAMIDRRGIGACIRSCIVSSLKQLDLDPEDCTVLLDGGLKAPIDYLFQQTVIRGDAVHKIISLASVVAKVHRDAHMIRLDNRHPAYDWERNKGYGTALHRTALQAQGMTPIHRKSFISKYFLQKKGT